MRLKICTESDYLQAHITVLSPQPGSDSRLAFVMRFKLWASSLFSKWTVSLR
jgi:hypothetical protein